MASIITSVRRLNLHKFSTNRSLSSQELFRAPFLQRKDEANYRQLTPLTHLERSGKQYPNSLSYHHGPLSRTWGEVLKRVKKFASALSKIGIGKDDTVSFIAPNTPPIFEAHFAVPGVGAVLHTINTRIDATTVAFQLKHGHSKVIFVDSEFAGVVTEALALLKEKHPNHPLPKVIDIFDPEYSKVKDGSKVGVTTIGAGAEKSIEFEDFVNSGDETFELVRPVDEWDAISLNYTSGTTGNPKGVVCHHRGAYLNAVSNIVEWSMPRHSRYLWVVPLFHCNGWCFAWTMAACTGVSVFMRQVRAEALFDLIEKHKIQYLCGAPITMNTMLNYTDKKKFNHDIKMWTAGAPPPPAVIKRFMDETGIKVQTAYGLTETYGPISSHVPDPMWEENGLTADECLQKCTYQVGDASLESLQVLDPETLVPVPADGKTIGEVMIRGNIVMKGYLNNEEATAEAFKGGWFRSGDLGVNHGNGRIELKDRSKDIIISGGENISSIEVENIILTHNLIGEVAVIAMPDEKWGEVPAAFVTLRPPPPGFPPINPPTPQEMLTWCRSKMAGFQTPKKYVFVESLPKTSTGKVQKNLLRKLL